MSLRPPVTEDDHIQGNILAPIELVKYGDYQCPHCGRAYPLVKRLQERLCDRLKFVFRNFPLKKIHPQAQTAAIATEAAALQGKYWEMHDILFENQKRLNGNSIMTYAESLGMNCEQFNQDILRPELADKVDAHFYSGMRSGVNATPTFFINGEKLIESWEDDGLFTFIKANFKL